MRDHPQVEFDHIARPVMDALPVGLVVVDELGTIVWANRGWSMIREWNADSRSDLGVGDSYVDGVADYLMADPDDAARINGGVEAVRTDVCDAISVDVIAQLPQASRWLCVTIVPVEGPDPHLVLVTHREITARKQREESLELFRDAVEHAGEFVLIADDSGRIEYINQAFSAWSGLSKDGARGLSIWAVTSADRDAEFMEGVMTALRIGKPWVEELRQRTVDGEVRWESLTVWPVRDEDGRLLNLVSIGRDVTEQRAYVDQLKRHAYYDSLTGLPNRMLFLDRLAHAHTRVQRSGQPLAVMFLDLNGFKGLNDRFGHQTGDQILAEVAQRLNLSLRASDTVARTGGDEFLFLLEEVATRDDALAVAQRVIEEISQPFEIDDAHVSVSAGIGIAFNTPAITDPEVLLNMADIALYHAKARLGDRIVIYRENMTMPVDDDAVR